MTCASCKQPNAPDRNYCAACGTQLARYCSFCGFRNAVVDRFCGGCGGDLRAASQEGTRRGAPGPAPDARIDPATAGGPSLTDLLQAAQETVELAAEAPEAKVSQDDIDNLFGE